MPHMPFMPGLWGHPSPPSSGGGSASADRARAKADEIETRLDRALVTMEAMWSILSERLGVTEEELCQRIVDLDLSDGRLDGKVRKRPMQCPQCDRTIPTRFARCLYCGADVQHNPFA